MWTEAQEAVDRTLQEVLKPYTWPLQTFQAPSSTIGGPYYILPINIGLGENVTNLNFVVDSSLPYSVVTNKTATASGLSGFQLLSDSIKSFGGFGESLLNELEQVTERRFRSDVCMVDRIQMNQSFTVGAECIMLIADPYVAAVGEKVGVPINGIIGADLLAQLALDIEFDVEKQLVMFGTAMRLDAGLKQIRGVKFPQSRTGVKAFFSPTATWVPEPGAVPATTEPIPDFNWTKVLPDPDSVAPPALDDVDQFLRNMLGRVRMMEDERDEPLPPAMSPAAPFLRAPPMTKAEPSPSPLPPTSGVGKTVFDIDRLFDEEPSPEPKSTYAPDPKTERNRQKRVLAIPSTGSPYSMMNWKAANAYGIYQNDPLLKQCPQIEVLNPRGEWQRLPLVKMQVNLCDLVDEPEEPLNANARLQWKLKNIKFSEMDQCVQFDKEVLVSIGDSRFDQFLKNGLTDVPYTGAALMVGQDVLSQYGMALYNRGGAIGFRLPDSASAAP